MSFNAHVLSDFRDFPAGKKSSVCIGNFDGIHLAHQKIILACLDSAKRHKHLSVALTFEPHPSQYFTPKTPSPLLMTTLEKRERLFKMGFDYVLEQKFNAKFMKISAEGFVTKVLSEHLGAQSVFVGSDFKFGFRAKGNVKLLKAMKFFKVSAISPVLFRGRRLSSSSIRDLIQEGNLARANQMLGHSYFLSGKIVQGKKRGRELGFRTANLKTDRECLPALGVYATLFQISKSKKIYRSVTNVGINPTFGDLKISIESHLFRFSGSLYGKKCLIYFVKRLRDEKKFRDREALQRQIERDVLRAKKVFKNLRVSLQ